MTDEEKKVETGEAVDNTDYIAAIKELKEKSVDRSQYEKLKAENKKLLDSIVNGTEIAQETVNEEPSIADLRKKVFDNPNQTNLEYVTNLLALRNALIEKGQPDPFVGASSHYEPTVDDYARAEKVARVFQEMVDLHHFVRDSNVPKQQRNWRCGHRY